ncbi:hypothetical protein M3Y98_00090500 [Aphelenchoides besseyi]|nr:hypothetical protein M3Y98_00090500 [Aphelenchoides besseyi]KAI6198506.1 hypothetical protein M3Y96_00526200 [Aphelenchoides besseyi]
MIFLNQSDLHRSWFDGGKEDQWTAGQKAVFGALGVYVFVSSVLVFFHFPISFLSLVLPIVLFVATTAINKLGTDEDLIFCTIIAVINSLIKLSAIIVYISAFNLNDPDLDSRLRSSTSPTDLNLDPKRVFFYSLIGVELAIVLLVLFLRCNLRMCRSHIVR